MKTSTLAAVLGNIVSLIAVALINFGIELTPQQQAEIVSALLVIVNTCALIIPALSAWWAKRQGRASAPVMGHVGPYDESGRALPGLLLVLGLVSLFAVSLQGCTLQPQNGREALALGYTAHTSATRLVTAATTSETITVDQAEQARTALVLAREQLDIAQALVFSDRPATDALTRANNALLIVDQILQEASRQ